MTEKILIAGEGGQGIMLLGKVLAEAAMREDKQVTWLPAYGAEVRGGTAYCMVIISDSPIGSPYIQEADSLIIMNNPSLNYFFKRLKPGGLLVLNSSLADEVPEGKAVLIKKPFSDIASDLGNIKVANMVSLGAYISKKKIVSRESIIGVIRQMVPESKKGLLEINIKALSAAEGVAD